MSGQGNPHIWCLVRGSPARAHVLSWYQQLTGRSPTFLLSQREGAPPTYGLGVNPRFLAELDVAQNGARLTVGNASPDDEGIYYCAVWFSGQYIFGEGTHLLYQAEIQPPALQPPQLSLFIPDSGPPFLGLCVALGHHPAPLRVSWVLRGLNQEEEDFTGGAGDPVVSWLQLPQGVAGTTMTCQGLHQSGVSEVVLPLPLSWDQGCRRRLGLQNWNQTHENSGDIPLAELKQTLTAITYYYLGLLGAAQFYTLVILWRNCCSWKQEGQKADPDSKTQAGGSCISSRALEHDQPGLNNFHVARTVVSTATSTSLLQPASP
ncbi:immunoglobulin alpha-2 heavy chain-like isoform X2 [Tamandua tetradactyla]